MAYEHRPNSGTLFTNKKKTAEKQPDYTGEANINGSIIKVAGWKKQGTAGPFISLAFTIGDYKKPQPVLTGSQQPKDANGNPLPF